MARVLEAHAGQVDYLHAQRGGQLDSLGTDFIIYPYRKPLSKNPDETPSIFFPLGMEIQVKASTNQETIGLVLPIQDGFPESIANRMTSYHWRQIKKHQEKHPRVCCILFVGLNRLNKTARDQPWERLKSEREIEDEIWHEIKRMAAYIKKMMLHRFRYLR